MKILWHSNAPWAPSGYGKQSKLFAPRLKEMLGHEVGISAFWGLRGARLGVDDFPIYPANLDPHGNDVLERHAEDFFGGNKRDGLVLPLTDIWVLWPGVLKELNVAAWVPVDHEPCQPPTVDTMKKGRVLPIAMSRFGERMLTDAGFRPVYVPHGADTNTLCPQDRVQARAALDLPQDAFIVGMVAANVGFRKSFPQAIRAFRIFRETHPEAVLYLHTFLGREHQGMDIRLLLEQEFPNKLERLRAVQVVDQYMYEMGLISDETLSLIYSSLDLLMNPAQGEGFGVTIIEAQACGTPVLVTNATAMTELCGSGYLVGGTPVYSQQFSSWQTLPDIDAMVAALETHYNLSAEEHTAARAKARAFALNYDADLITQTYWPPALAEIEDRLLKPRPRQPRKKAAKR